MSDQGPSGATDSSGSKSDHASEFSKAVGDADGAIWRKHFQDEKASKDSPKPSSKSSSSDSSEKPARRQDSANSRDSSEKSSSAKDTGKDQKSKPAPSAGSKESAKSESKPDKTGDDSEATGQKTADKAKDTADREPSDPEAPLKKARDLYQQAQKTEDRREARKLYKRAMVEAFGEVPSEFDDKRYAAVRTERAAAKAALDEQAKKNETRIKDAAEKLKPAIYVMRTLETAGLGDKLTVPMVERAVSVMHALRKLDDGDFTALAEVVARASGVDADEAMKRFVNGTRVTPEGKRSRAAAAEAAARAADAERRVQALEAKLSEQNTQQTEAQKKQERERQQTAAREQYLDDIETELDGHAVLQLPRGKERVLAYLIKTRHPTLKTARFTYQQAADKIVAGERRRVQSARHLLDDAPATEPARRSSNGSSVSRSEIRDAGVRDESAEAAFDRIFEKNRAAGGTGRRR